MATMKLGSKAELFHLHGRTWHCSSGLPSDVIIEIGDFSFHLHKFPLLSRSRTLEELIGESSDEDSKYCQQDLSTCILELHDIPGGPEAFLLVANFCYGVKQQLTSTNIVSLRCAAEYLQMTEDYGQGNLIAQAETFLNRVFFNWVDTIKVLESCQEILPHAEEVNIVSRCITSLATKACADPNSLSWSVVSGNPFLWNGIRTPSKATRNVSEDWWYEEVSFLKLPLYKRLILAVSERGMKLERIAASLMHYAQKHLPLSGRNGYYHTTGSNLSEQDQRVLLEQIIELLPDKKGIVQTKLLFRILKTSIILSISPSCIEVLEKRVGNQLEDAVLEDIIIPNTRCLTETLYDVDCVQRIVEHFMMVYKRDASDRPSSGTRLTGVDTPLVDVVNLVDSYLVEVAPDVNLKLSKFESLATLVPEYARPLDDGIYRAIDIYLKAHPGMTDSEREKVCSRLMNCQKLSAEASKHAAQNERLPLRVIVQVLFFEQIRLRTSVAACFEDPSFAALLSRIDEEDEDDTDGGGNRLRMLNNVPMPIAVAMAMGERVSELEKECLSMKQEIQKLVKTKGSWNNLFKMLRLRLRLKSNPKPRPQNPKTTTPSAAAKLLLHRKQVQQKRSVQLGC